MKKITQTLTLIILAGIFNVRAQQPGLTKSFTMKADLSGAMPDSVSIIYKGGGPQTVNIVLPIVNQHFVYNGVIDEPQMAVIQFIKTGEQLSRTAKQERSLRIYLDQGTITLTGNPSDLKSLKVSGSKTQNEYEEFQKAQSGIMQIAQPLSAAYYAEKDPEKKTLLKDQLDGLSKQGKKIAYRYFVAHPNSYVTADQIKYYASAWKLDTLQAIYDHFNAGLKQSAGARQFKKELIKMQGGSPGSPAAAFATTDIAGNALSLADFKGKYILLDFWASWCVPCRKGNPHLLELYQQYHSKGLEIIGISDDDNKPEAWKAAVLKDNIGVWHHVLRGFNMEKRLKDIDNPDDISNKFGIHSLPTKILIDPSGMIIGRYGDSIGADEHDLDIALNKIYNTQKNK